MNGMDVVIECCDGGWSRIEGCLRESVFVGEKLGKEAERGDGA